MASNKTRMLVCMAAIVCLGVSSSALGQAGLEKRIVKAVFTGQTLEEVVSFISRARKVDIRVDWPRLEAAGISRSTPIRCELRDISFGGALTVVCRLAGGPVPLEWEHSEGAVSMPAKTVAARGYALGVSGREQILDLMNLVNGIAQTEDARVTEDGGTLKVTASAQGHRRIEQLLRAYRAPTSPQDWQGLVAVRNRLMGVTLSVAFKATSLPECIARLVDATRTSIVLNESVLMGAGIDLRRTKVDLEMKDATAWAVLEELMRKMGGSTALTVVPVADNQALWVTTRDDAARMAEVVSLAVTEDIRRKVLGEQLQRIETANERMARFTQEVQRRIGQPNPEPPIGFFHWTANPPRIICRQSWENMMILGALFEVPAVVTKPVTKPWVPPPPPTPMAPEIDWRGAAACAWAQRQFEAGIAGHAASCGLQSWSQWCARFVANAYGAPGAGADSANQLWKKLQDQGRAHSREKPTKRGSLVFWTWKEQGHVGIWIGDGWVIHAGGTYAQPVRRDKLENIGKLSVMREGNSEYLGWAAPPENWPGTTLLPEMRVLEFDAITTPADGTRVVRLRNAGREGVRVSPRLAPQVDRAIPTQTAPKVESTKLDAFEIVSAESFDLGAGETAEIRIRYRPTSSNKEDAAELHFLIQGTANMVSVSSVKLRGQGLAVSAAEPSMKPGMPLTASGPAEPGSAVFFGQEVQAESVVFVLDRSASMISSIDSVREETLRCIGRLRESQRFHIVMFNNGPPEEFNPRKLVGADKDSVAAAKAFMEKIQARGQTDPAAALTRAFDVLDNADSKTGRLIVLLTDGWFPNTDTLEELVTKRNKSRSIRIDTYLIRERDGEGFLEKLAKENGGRFQLVPK